MNAEREYYEIKEFWDPARARGTDVLRFRETEAYIPTDTASLLDVGCGNGDFLHYIATRRNWQRLHGFDRSHAALVHVRTPKTQGDIDQLPFADREFDCVVACEVIEHLPFTAYQAALRELARVARQTVLITVPAAERLRANMIECGQCAGRFNANHHFRSFTLETMRTLFDTHGLTVVTTSGLVERTDYPGLRTLLRWKKGLPPRKNPHSFAIPCPICGASIPGTGKASTKTAQQRWWEPYLRAAWPHFHHPRWYVGVYRCKGDA